MLACTVSRHSTMCLLRLLHQLYVNSSCFKCIHGLLRCSCDLNAHQYIVQYDVGLSCVLQRA